MTTVNNTLLNELGLSKKPEAKDKNELGQDAFMQLMMAQLQNQDPFKPLESGEFLSQIAQFTQVSGIQNLEASFGQLSESLVSNQALQASALVGRSVLVPSESGVLPAGDVMKGSVEVTSSVADMAVGIYDGAGQLIKRINLGQQGEGLVSFQWDGKTDQGSQAAAGVYTVRAEGLRGNESVSLQTYAQVKVDSVTLNKQGGGITLNTAGLGSTEFSSVKQIM